MCYPLRTGDTIPMPTSKMVGTHEIELEGKGVKDVS